MQSPGRLLFCFSVSLILVASGRRSAAQTLTPPPLDAPTIGVGAPHSTGSGTGAIFGVVTDTDGALVPGAKVALLDRDSRPLQTAVTGNDGHFSFRDAGPGSFTVTAVAAGMEGGSREVSLQEGELLEMPELMLRVATANTDVEVRLTREEIATEDMHVEEKQRLLGFAPNFYVTYDWQAPALTAKQKFKLAGRAIVDPASFGIVAGIAGIEQATNTFPGYRQGAAGYAKRYGSGFGDFSIGTVLGGALLPAMFHQDPRYFYKGTGSNRSRAFYALSTGFIARGDNGRWQPAYAAVLGDFASGAISNLYYPAGSRSGATLTVENGLLGVAANGVGNLVQEFFFKKITPGSRKAALPQGDSMSR